jgi:hypothetical protein
MPKKKKQKKVFTHSMTPGAVLGKEGWETDDNGMACIQLTSSAGTS